MKKIPTKRMKKLVCLIILVVGFLSLGNESYGQEPAKARVVELTGEVRFKNPGDAEWQAVSKGMEISEGANLFVGPDSDCQIVFGDDFKSVTRIKQDTNVVLKSIGANPQLDIAMGEVFALVRNLKKESSFRVATPTAVATVRGTAFSFAADGIGNQVASTVQVYEHTVGLNPIGKPDAEVPVQEGYGATMRPDGVMEKEFALSPEDMQAGREFMSVALGVMALERPEPVEAPEAKSDASSSKEDPREDDNKKKGGPNPPGPDSGGSSPDARVDSAVDGMLMDMAQDSESSKSGSFDGATVNHMLESLADLNGDSAAPGDISGKDAGQPAPALYAEAVNRALTQAENLPTMIPDTQMRMTEVAEGRVKDGPVPLPAFSAMYAEAVKSAIKQTDYFQNMPPVMQERMMVAVEMRVKDDRALIMGDGAKPGIFPGTGQTSREPLTSLSVSIVAPSMGPSVSAKEISPNPNVLAQDLQPVINITSNTILQMESSAPVLSFGLGFASSSAAESTSGTSPNEVNTT